MKRLLCIILTAIITITFVGCGKKDKKSPNKDNPASIEDNSDKNKPIKDTDSEKTEKPKSEEKDDVVDSPTSDKNESEPLITPPAPSPEPPPAPTPTPTPDTTERVFKISSKNHNLEIVDGGEIRTIGLGVAENIREILSIISSQYFDGSTIELSTIDTINSQKIAVINLIDNDDYWYQAMQGSTGGQMTAYNLIENVLQRQYPGYWVDGVRFTLNGQSITNSEHCPDLSKTTYR